MQRALDSLKVKTDFRSTSETSLTATHYYVRFLPKTKEELDLLIEDETLKLFDFPLDYEILQDGTYYQDSSLVNQGTTWLYTVVPIDYKFPNVFYEKIEDAYIPNENSETTELRNASFNLLNQIEEEAFRITGNKYEKQSTEFRKARYPSGQITVYNDSKNTYDGVSRIKVRAHSFFKIIDTYTDDNGNYRFSTKFMWSPHYYLLFTNKTGFKIWGNWSFLLPATYALGEHSNSGYSCTIWNNSSAWKWCHINNAESRFRLNYCPTLGLSVPPQDLRIWAYTDSNSGWGGSAPMLRHTWGYNGFTSNSELGRFLAFFINIPITVVVSLTKFIQPDIFYVHKSNNSTADIYDKIFHESSHASHWVKAGNSYWCRYINYVISFGGYGNKDNHNAGVVGIGEMWGYYMEGKLMQMEFNSNSYYGGTDYWFKPQIIRLLVEGAGFSTKEIYACFNSSIDSHSKLKQALINKYNKDIQVNSIFSRYGF